jgi:hypothetical protein
MRILKVVFICSICFLFCAASYADQTDCEKLKDGKPIITVEGTGKTRVVTGKILINAPIEDCWKVISDFDSWPQWSPDLKYHHIIGNADGRAIAISGQKLIFLTVHVPGSVAINEEKKQLIFRQLTDEEVKKYEEQGMKIGKANFTRDVIEDYRLESCGEGTMLIHYMKWDLKIPAPTSIENFASKIAVPEFFKAAKQRIESTKAKD